MAKQAMPASAKRYAWLRFSTRTMLIALTLMCALTGFFAARIQRANRQAADIAALKEMGVRVWYEYQTNLNANGSLDGPDTLKSPKFQPDDFFYDVTLLRAFDGVDQKQLDRVWAIVGRFPRLQSARIWSSSGDHSEGIRNLSRTPDLRHLSIMFGTAKSADWSPVGQLSQLRFLNLSVDVDDKVFEHLRRLRHLRHLSVRGQGITGRGFQMLEGNENLEYLDIYDVDVTDSTLAEFAKLTNLRTLRIWSGDFGDGGVRHVATMKKLEELMLRECKITDDGVASLAALTNLTDLSLRETSVTDKGLEHLQPLINLRDLSLNGTRISDQGLSHLSSIASLRFVDCGDTAVSTAGADALKQKLPNCTVLVDQPSPNQISNAETPKGEPQ